MIFWITLIQSQVICTGLDQVLGLMNGSPIEGNEVILEDRDDTKEESQSWIRCAANAEGWFAFENPTSRRFLTNGSFSRTIITGTNLISYLIIE